MYLLHIYDHEPQQLRVPPACAAGSGDTGAAMKNPPSANSSPSLSGRQTAQRDAFYPRGADLPKSNVEHMDPRYGPLQSARAVACDI